MDGRKVDEVATRTGFRKTRFGKGMIWLNDRVIQMKGFAQRTRNEWPGAVSYKHLDVYQRQALVRMVRQFFSNPDILQMEKD